MSSVRPIVRPCLRPRTFAVTDAALGLVYPAATHYVSSAASNGYAVGTDSGAGTSKAAPWLTLDYAITNAPAGSVIAVNDGTYTAATFYTISKTLTIRGERRRQTILRAASGQTRIFNYAANSATRRISLYGLVLDGQNNTTRGLTIGSATSTALMTVDLVDCHLKDITTQHIFGSSQKALDLNVRSCSASGAVSERVVYVLNSESGTVRVEGLDVDCTSAGVTTKAVINVIPATAGTFAYVSGVTGTYAASTSGGIYGVKLQNADGAEIAGCALTVSGPAGSVGALYWIHSSLATATADNGLIAGNMGTNNTDGGYGCIYGLDGTTVADGKHNNGTIRNNNITCNAAAAVPIHGLMIGYGSGGEVYENTVTGAGLATIAKQQTGGEFHHNTISGAVSESMRAKGATGTAWRNNAVTLAAGHGMNVDANDSPATASTGIVFEDNVFTISATPAKVTEVDVGSDATFSGNTYTVNAALGADPWTYQGTSYQTLAAWKAAKEPDALP